MEPNDTILIIGEGPKTEKIIHNSLKEHFFNKPNQKSEYEFISYKSHLYSLYSKLKKDDFITETIDLLIEIDPKQEDKFKDRKVTQIFLFFDFDGHTIQNKRIRDDQIKELLEHFNNETENGMLYLSYPMVESLKDYHNNYKCFNHCTTDIDLGKEYKKIAAERSDFKYPKSYTLEHWYFIFKTSISKANCLLNDKYTMPDYGMYSQNFTTRNIYIAQLNKYINTESKVAILSSYPFFIVDYFGEKLFNKL